MNLERGKRPDSRAGLSARTLWIAISSLFAALLLCLPGTLVPALAAPSDNTDTTSVAADTVIKPQTADTNCPVRIKVLASNAAACLPVKAAAVLGAAGFPGSDTVTVITAHAGDPHVAYNTQADGCAACHRTHGETQNFVSMNTISHAVECMACHDGTGATSDVHADYTDTATAGAVNDPTTRSYYMHDALAVKTGHTAASSDAEGGSIASNEFQGVANRHADCVDCHNPHATALTPISTQRTQAGESLGWSLSGATQSVSVANVTADSATAFVGHASASSNFEYQLCMKCHSSFTVLAGNDAAHPSRDWLDKAAEIDTDTAVNKSFHPISRAGTNQTAAMAASLTGTSAYKRWKFTTTDTVRCTNCHAGGAVDGGAGQTLAPHSSANRGILILPYRDRALIPASESTLGHFEEFRVALCFACHTDVPFQNNTTTGTNFMYHFEHVAVVTGTVDSTTDLDIDKPGAGNGHALCAECHFRLHSTKNAVGNQDITGTRLVNFAPNVEPVNGVIKWTPRSGSTPGTCTLKCHGAVHNGTAY